MDCLERKMDNLHSELAQYKSKCVTLEGQNGSLMAQVKKLQAQLASKNLSVSPCIDNISDSLA